ncbi:TPA: hypothetical protein I8Y21_005979 [Klebsiella oxytoca]|uniref:Uncharacterized protein n=1 Tax=Klebsiella oxytoca TaxID=571 RepID=A0AAN5LE74_KLEOX|nr:hypothetical protein [Klebsiella oxytoca]
MMTDRPDLTANLDTPERNRLMRFTCGVQTAQHQANRALESAQEGNWFIALEFLNVCSRTLDSLKRVAREVPPATNEEKPL